MQKSFSNLYIRADPTNALGQPTCIRRREKKTVKPEEICKWCIRNNRKKKRVAGEKDGALRDVWYISLVCRYERKKEKKNDQVSCIYLKYSMMFPLCVLGAIVVSSMLVKAFFVGLPSSSTFFFFSLFFFFFFFYSPHHSYPSICKRPLCKGAE